MPANTAVGPLGAVRQPVHLEAAIQNDLGM